jgi:hypothetical protein
MCVNIIDREKRYQKAFDEHKKHRKEQQRQADMKAEREEQQWLRRIPL